MRRRSSTETTSVNQVRDLIWTRLVTPAGVGTVAMLVWSFVDARFVHAADHKLERQRDSIALVRIEQKIDGLAANVDSVRQRVTQIKCGRKVVEGCR